MGIITQKVGKCMNKLQVFQNSEFGEIRTITKDNEPMFCLADVCKALELEQVSRVKARLKADGVTTSKVTDRLGREQEATFINESNLYKTIFQSRKESAERFTEWVTSEVLPSIRKNGGYIAGQEMLSDDELLAKALMVAQNKIAERDTQIKSLETEVVQMDRTISELQPKANYVDMILQSKSTVTVTQIAQDYGMTARKFNQVLKELEIQRKVGNQWILYAKHQGKGYVHSSTFGITKRNGEQDVAMNTEWTQKGRLFLYEKLKEQGILPMIEKDE